MSPLCISYNFLSWDTGWKIHLYNILQALLLLFWVTWTAVQIWSESRMGSKCALFFFQQLHCFIKRDERRGIERHRSHQLFYFCVCNSWKGQSFSNTFGTFQKRSQLIVRNLIMDTLMSVWTFDCHQIEENYSSWNKLSTNMALHSA